MIVNDVVDKLETSTGTYQKHEILICYPTSEPGGTSSERLCPA